MSKSVDKKIHEEFDFEIIEAPVESSVLVVSQTSLIVPDENTISVIEQDVNQDYVNTRQTITHISNLGSQAMEDLVELARDGENPVAYDSIGSLMKNIVNAQKTLMDVHKTMKDLQKKIEPEEGKPQTVNNTQENTYFVGSTAELQEQIEIERDAKKLAVSQAEEIAELREKLEGKENE